MYCMLKENLFGFSNSKIDDIRTCIRRLLFGVYDNIEFDNCCFKFNGWQNSMSVYFPKNMIVADHVWLHFSIPDNFEFNGDVKLTEIVRFRNTLLPENFKYLDDCMENFEGIDWTYGWDISMAGKTAQHEFNFNVYTDWGNSLSELNTATYPIILGKVLYDIAYLEDKIDREIKHI